MIVLPSMRKYNHFNIDDEVAVFIENNWYFGKVKNGYRHHDGCVSYELENYGPKETDENFKSFLSCGFMIPGIMLKSEYDYFQKNPEEYVEWISKSYNRKYNGNYLEIAIIPGSEHAIAKQLLLNKF